jgi:hypothetical protein
LQAYRIWIYFLSFFIELKHKNAAPCRTPQRQGANRYRTKNLRTKTDKNTAEKG